MLFGLLSGQPYAFNIFQKKRYDDYHVVRSFVWHKYNMRSEYMYQKLESPEACSGFVRSLNNGLMSI
jgi:hypothetical protein